MIYNRYYFVMLIRVILLSITVIPMIFFFMLGDRPFTSAFFMLLFLLQIFLLFRYLNRTNRDLARFLLYLNEQDTSIIFDKENIQKTFKGLQHSFDKINQELKRIRFEKKVEEQLLDTLVEHLSVGILAFYDTGETIIFNRTAQELLSIKKLTNIQQLSEKYEKLHNFITRLGPDEQQLYEIKTYDEPFQSYTNLHLTFSAETFKLSGKAIKLISFQNIRDELDAKELEAWQKLIRVLTHEISNSITSITTLTASIRRNITRDGEIAAPESIRPNVLEDTLKSTRIIEERSNNLNEFIQFYKTVAELPKPNFSTIAMDLLVQNLEKLFEKQFKKNNIDFLQIINPPDIRLEADQKLLEQVLINLVNNAIYAVSDVRNPRIVCRVIKNSSGQVEVRMEDNGCGIPSEIYEHIFIPFFTTKDKGSGIGLSLSREIMRLHKGYINVNSEPEKGSSITLRFNN